MQSRRLQQCRRHYKHRHSWMVQYYIILVDLPDKVWIAWTHIPLETGNRRFKSGKTQPHFSRRWYAWMTKACLDNQRVWNSLWWVLIKDGGLFVWVNIPYNSICEQNLEFECLYHQKTHPLYLQSTDKLFCIRMIIWPLQNYGTSKVRLCQVELSETAYLNDWGRARYYIWAGEDVPGRSEKQ